jgi:Outer membrane protein beta-barrel domain
MRLSLCTLLLQGAAGLILASPLAAQTPANNHPEVDFAVTYSAQRSNLTTGSFFWTQGGSFEISTQTYRGFGIAMNLTGLQATNIQGTGIDLDTITTTFGPRYTWSRPSRKLAFFGQGLIGDSHGWNSLFPATGGASSSFDAFALQVGGGVDLRISPHLALRPIQADWVRTQFPNATTNVQNNLRLGAGFVFRIPQ